MTRRRTALERLSGDRGAAAVEFALLFPIFAVLAMGTIAAGLAFSKQITVTQAAREASRYGSTLPIEPLNATGLATWLTRLDAAATAAAGPAASPVAGYDYRCVAYVRTTASGAVDAAASRHRVNGGAVTGGMCPSALASSVPAAPVTDYAQVIVTRNSSFFVVFFDATVRLDAVSLTPFEGKAP